MILAKQHLVLAAVASALFFSTRIGATPQQSPDKGDTKSPTASTSAQHAEELLYDFALRSEKIRLWLRKARIARSRNKVRCLDKLLSQSHALERQGQEELRGVRKAEKQSNQLAIRQHFMRLAQFNERSVLVVTEATSCY